MVITLMQHVKIAKFATCLILEELSSIEVGQTNFVCNLGVCLPRGLLCLQKLLHKALLL